MNILNNIIGNDENTSIIQHFILIVQLMNRKTYEIDETILKKGIEIEKFSLNKQTQEELYVRN